MRIPTAILDPFRTFDFLRRGDFPVLSVLQIPLVFAIKIFDIGLYNVSHYTTMIMHNRTALINVGLSE
jgi:hypothetical protein